MPSINEKPDSNTPSNDMKSQIINKFLAFLFIIVLIGPMTIGRGLHLMFGCPDAGCLNVACVETGSEHQCSCPHGTQDVETNDSPWESSSDHRHECSFCDFLTLPKTTASIVLWQPDDAPVEDRAVVFSQFLITVYRPFAFGRAPPIS